MDKAMNQAMNQVVIQMTPPRIHYSFEVFRQGKLAWKDDFWNTVALVGKNDLLDKYFGGSAYTAAWYVGLIDNVSFTTGPVEADTMVSHGGWIENVAYDEATRPAITWGAASAKSKPTSAPSVFTVNTNVIVRGGFIVTEDTKGGTSGILYSAGSFTQGNRSLLSGDVLRINLTAAVA
jgi:hypothetical protein